MYNKQYLYIYKQKNTIHLASDCQLRIVSIRTDNTKLENIHHLKPILFLKGTDIIHSRLLACYRTSPCCHCADQLCEFS